jgi:outer membrane protein assembly factor BamB
MTAIEVRVRTDNAETLPSPLGALLGTLDFMVDGVNLTARLGHGAALGLLGELGTGLSALCRGRWDRFTTPFYSGDEAWEVGLEADGSDVLVSVFRTAPAVAVAVHERRVDLVAFRRALVQALDAALDAGGKAPAGSLRVARDGLDSPWPSYGRAALRHVEERLSSGGRAGFAIDGRLRVRIADHLEAPPNGDEPKLERADLHALLAPGSVRLRTGAATLELSATFPFLVAERLLGLAEESLEACRDERPLFRRIEVDGAQIALRSLPAERSLVLRVVQRATGAEGVGISGVSPADFARAAVAFARAVHDVFTEHDPSQAKNLRLAELAHDARTLDEALAQSDADDSIQNPDPESYKGFGLPRRESSRGSWSQAGKMRFSPRWVASVPSIDLAATFLCGERLLLSSARQTACLDRTTGAVLWRRALPRAASVPTPLGLARIADDGTVTLHDFERGESRFTLRLAPRGGGGATGAVVNAPGLPRLLALSESDRAVSAIDLVTGDLRWRYTAQRSSSFRLRRAGRLLLVAGGDSALVALDAASGEVVWRVREKLPFTGDIAIDRDAAFATLGGPIGPTRLVHVDLWSGKVRWCKELSARPLPGQPPLVSAHAVLVPTRDRRGTGFLSFARGSGDALACQDAGLLAPTTAWLAVDDLFFANSAAGRLMALDARTGSVVYSRDFPRHVEADQPRRLEPILRNGALFVPQHEVHVLRPSDGEQLGTLPTDLIPDLLRVDDQCNAYVAEESGHVAAFGVGPRLSLVK